MQSHYYCGPPLKHTWCANCALPRRKYPRGHRGLVAITAAASSIALKILPAARLAAERLASKTCWSNFKRRPSSDASVSHCDARCTTEQPSINMQLPRSSTSVVVLWQRTVAQQDKKEEALARSTQELTESRQQQLKHLQESRQQQLKWWQKKHHNLKLAQQCWLLSKSGRGTELATRQLVNWCSSSIP